MLVRRYMCRYRYGVVRRYRCVGEEVCMYRCVCEEVCMNRCVVRRCVCHCVGW